ncbi:MAG TPA: UDP-N-acetylmuramate--L-alanine ligase [Gemmatimonadaceae bacterium]|nr:UDP-N-acetylmuramate--L-alanine ligase [Gemmatimonadaceae bacterium]
MADDNGNVLDEVAPGSVQRVHLVGVAGTGMGAFAGMLKAAGYIVTGSDENVYPPMSDMLREWGIEVFTPYAPANLDRAKPDLVIIGNVIRRVNPEAMAARERGLPQMSFPAAFGSLILADKHSVVVVGTHGKTTTSALMAHVLVDAGLDPTFLVGGVTVNYGGNFRLGRGKYVVVEGDEYDTAYFDKGPKFLHYRARTALLTSIEFDHADIFRDMPHYESAFESFVTRMPADGVLAVSASYPRAVEMARRLATSKVVTYAVNGQADYRADNERFSPEGTRFRIHAPRMRGKKELVLPMSGYHNIENAAGVYAAARSIGLSHDQIAHGFATFKGVKRRQEERGEIGGVLVIDDFAHHPTAVRETIEGIRQRYPDRRLWAVFEPRSNTSRRNIHQADYAKSFGSADLVTLREPEPHDKVPANERLDVRAIVAELKSHGIIADSSPDVAVLVQNVSENAERNDLILVMSNGSFGGFIPSLMEALSSRFGGRG